MAVVSSDPYQTGNAVVSIDIDKRAYEPKGHLSRRADPGVDRRADGHRSARQHEVHPRAEAARPSARPAVGRDHARRIRLGCERRHVVPRHAARSADHDPQLGQPAGLLLSRAEIAQPADALVNDGFRTLGSGATASAPQCSRRIRPIVRRTASCSRGRTSLAAWSIESASSTSRRGTRTCYRPPAATTCVRNQNQMLYAAHLLPCFGGAGMATIGNYYSPPSVLRIR